MNKTGRLGENLVERLLTEQDLVVEKPTPDNFGVDWVVRWPIDYVKVNAFDQATPSPRMHLQVKATQKGKKSVSLKLSAAHHLVQLNDPCAICAIIFNEVEPEYLVLFHIAGTEVERILSALRKCSLQKKKPSQTTISFSFSKGVRLPIESAALRSSLEDMTGRNLQLYSSEKALYRETAGYDDSWLSIETTISFENEEELKMGFLGEKPLNVTEAIFKNTRFDMTVIETFGSMLPENNPIPVGPYKMTIGMPKENSTEIILKAGGGESISLCGDMITTHMIDLPNDQHVLKWTNEYLTMRFEGGNANITFHFDHILETPQTPSVVQNNIKFIETLCEERVKLYFNKPSFEEPIFYAELNDFDAQFLGRLKSAKTILDQVERIWDESGTTPYLIDLKSIDSKQLSKAWSLISSDVTYSKGSVVIRKIKSGMQEKRLDSLGLIYLVEIGEHVFATAAKFDADISESDDLLEIETNIHRPLIAKRLNSKNLQSDLKKFSSKVQKLSSTSLWLLPEMDEIS